MVDTINLGNAHLEDAGVHSRLPADIRTYCWQLMDTMGSYKTSTALDLVNNVDIEAQFLFRNPLDVLRKLKSVPSKEHQQVRVFPYLEGLLLHVLGTHSLHKKVRTNGKLWVSNVIDPES
jgi:hypothetical protein